MSETGPDSGVRVILTTAPSGEVAERLALELVAERLVACVNVVPGVLSVYRWQGAVRRDDEVMLVLKTVAGRVPGLLARLPELHPYDVPEILVLRVEEGSRSYLEWLAGETEAAGEVGR
jgi:periplasmic divalent cation tolerance protein